MKTRNELLDLLNYIENIESPPLFLHDIATEITKLLKLANKHMLQSEKAKKIAIGIEVYISHDYELSISELGKKILKTIDLILDDM